MESIISICNAVLPLFILGLMGFIYQKTIGFKESTVSQIESFIFYYAFPVSFFSSVSEQANQIGVSLKFLLVILFASSLSFTISYLIAKRISKDIALQGVIHQSLFRCNMVIFGIALASGIFNKTDQAFYLVAMAPVMLLQNIGMILGMNIFGKPDEKNSMLKAVKNALLSPHILSIVLGVIYGKMGLGIPSILQSVCDYLGNMSTPLCVLLIGARTAFKSEGKSNNKLVFMILFLRALIYPLIAVAIAYFARLNLIESYVILLLFSAPASFTNSVVANQMEWDVKLASTVIVYATILSIPFLMMWIYFLERVIFSSL